MTCVHDEGELSCNKAFFKNLAVMLFFGLGAVENATVGVVIRLDEGPWNDPGNYRCTV